MPIAPITEPLEMAANWDTLLYRLRASEKYRHMFQAAFGSEQIDDQKMLKALAQYMGTLVSAGSRYDAYVQGKGSLAPDEMQGLDIFRSQCASCHTEPLFTNQAFINNGLDVVSNDIGRMLITRKEEDRGSFRVPSLRNVALTYPYMHDGRFRTLDQVLNHYTSDKSDKPLADARVRNIRLNSEEKRALIAFLKTLTDYDFVSNPKHAQR
jgi:cytochrome c peroxidase